jgi:hypothetical protein
MSGRYVQFTPPWCQLLKILPEIRSKMMEDMRKSSLSVCPFINLKKLFALPGARG